MFPLLVAAALAEPTPTEAWLHLSIGDAGPVNGRVRYSVHLDEPSDVLVLDLGDRVHVTGAWLGSRARGGPRLQVSPNFGYLTLRDAAPFPAGAVDVTIEFTTGVSEKASRGFFSEQVGGRRFLYTMFEPEDAREAFPCFDAPRFKLPWTVDVEAPNDRIVVGNMAAREPAAGAHGRRTWVFEKSPPMPSYLVALAAGRFSVTAVPGVGRAGKEVRVFSTDPEVGAFYAAGVAPAVANAEGWMDETLPWPKLDIVVPRFDTWFGAMENPGLVVVNAGAYSVAEYILTHELLHYWFGDRVTPQTWGDYWLNEGPAYWVGLRLSHALDLGSELDRGLGVGLEGAVHSRQSRFIERQEVGAAAVLDSLDTWRSLVPSEHATLDEVLRSYVRARIDGHSDTDSFVAELAAAWPDLPVHGVFFGLLDESDTPSVTQTFACAGGRARVTLKQARPGRTMPPLLPVFLRGDGFSTRVVLVSDSAEVRLDQCPRWLLVNATGAGFYRAQYNPEQAKALQAAKAAGQLTDREVLVLESGQ